jgi:predicted Zn-ribbon and HTH transcriptional regulator
MPTIRQEMIGLLGEYEMDARDLSQTLGIREKEVYDHLNHIARSLVPQGKRIRMKPCRCLRCGFVFKDRKRFHRPGRCPRCKEGHVAPAAYQITSR